MIRIVLSAFLLSLSGVALADQRSTYEQILAGKTCKDWMNSVVCNYKIGESLEISIDGIGRSDAVVTYVKTSMDNGYYAKQQQNRYCISIHPNLNPKPQFPKGVAFISPRNGKVYQYWGECEISQ